MKKRKLDHTYFQHILEPHSKRRCFNTETDALNFLKQLKKQIPKKQKKSISKKLTFRRTYTIGQQALVIYLRFKSLQQDDNLWLSPQEVFQRTGIKRGSQFNIIKRWKERGFLIQSRLKDRGKRQILTTQQKNTISNPQLLLQISHLSLKARAQYIKEMLQLNSFSSTTLANYYKRLGVRYRKPQYQFIRKHRDIYQITQQQRTASLSIVSLMRQRNKEIIYIDETTFNLWQLPNKCWLLKGMSLNITHARGPSYTVIGALSNIRGLIHYEIFQGSNNQHTFLNFIENLKKKVISQAVVVMDNLTVHKAKIIQEIFTNDFQQFFLPPYSCTLNPIERIWSLIKNEWKKSQHNLSEYIKNQQEEAKQLIIIKIQTIIENIPKEKSLSLSRSHIPFLIKSLQGYIV